MEAIEIWLRIVMMRMMMIGWRGSLLLLLLLSFSCGGIASSSSSTEEDKSAILVFDAVSDIVQSISTTRNWSLDHVRIVNIDSEDVRFTKATVYELDIQIGDLILPARFIDEVATWQRLSDLDAGPGDQHHQERITNTLWGSKALQSVLTPFQLNGPVDLSFDSSEMLQDSSQEREDIADFKKLNLAIGSSVEVEGAREVSLAHPVELLLPINRSSPIRSLAASILSLAAHASENEDVAVRLSLHITGPTLVASITGLDLPLHRAEEVDLDSGFMKLFYKGESEHIGGQSHPPPPDFSKSFDKASIWPFPFLNSSDPRLSVLEEMLKSYLGSSSYKRSFTILHAKVAALTFVLFEFEMERKLNKEDFEPELWPEWKTRPSVKRYRFQVLAKVQDNTLVPITVQPVKRYKSVETYTWRHITSNVSYTRFSSYLVPSSPMTLDIY